MRVWLLLALAFWNDHFTDTMQRTSPEHCVVMEQACSETDEKFNEIWQMRGGQKKTRFFETSNVDFAFTLGLYNYNTKGGCLQRNISR
jgi:hypothetical protein